LKRFAIAPSNGNGYSAQYQPAFTPGKPLPELATIASPFLTELRSFVADELRLSQMLVCFPTPQIYRGGLQKFLQGK